MNKAKFLKGENNKIVIENMSQTAIINIMKCNIFCDFIFKDSSGMITDQISLFDRVYQGDVNMINVVINSKSKLISYDDLIAEVVRAYEIGVLSVHIDSNVLSDKEPLILMVANFKTAIIESCTYIDYNYKSQRFSVYNIPTDKAPVNEFHYFEANNSLLLFSVNGPNLVIDKFSNVEQVMC